MLASIDDRHIEELEGKTSPEQPRAAAVDQRSMQSNGGLGFQENQNCMDRLRALSARLKASRKL